MFRILSVAVLALAVSGCALRQYDVTLSNGTVVSARSKPKLVEGLYEFKDLNGKVQKIPQYRISEIAPHTVKEKKSPFNNYGAK